MTPPATAIRHPRAALALLTLVYCFNFIDRQLVGVLGQSIKADLDLSDTQLGLLGGLAFALLYTTLGIPIARVAERRSRVRIIAVALAVWSAMTALIGCAGSFATLFLARVGVGVGEAGCSPPAQSLISDMVPPERRATALATFSLGVPLGMMLSAIGGGWIAQSLGWRMAFVALGLPGIVLAGVVALLLREPPRAAHDAADTAPPPFAEVLGTLWRTRAFVHMALGASLASFAGYGLTSFTVPLLVRRGWELREAATGFGLVVGLALAIGIGGGGWLSDRLTRRDPGAAGLVSGMGVGLGGVLFLAALTSGAFPFWLTMFAPFVLSHLYFGPTYAVTVNSVGPRARATAMAVLLLAMNAIGLGLGPLAVGALSDHFAPSLGSADGLALALRLDMLVYLWAAAHFLVAAAKMRKADQPHNSAR